jgi:outer membrane scaffolding protein for murein synthesis (MipA/OmpV family)
MSTLRRHYNPQSMIALKSGTLALLCLAMPMAIAQGTESEATEPLWEWRLAGFGHYGSAYPASEDYQLNIIPLPYPIFRGKYLRLGDDRENPVTSRLFRRDRIKLDFSFGLGFPVDSDDIEARTGMPDLDLLLEAGPELEMEFASPAFFDGRWLLSLDLRAAFSFDDLDATYQGLVMGPELVYLKKLARQKDELKIRLTPTFANSRYMGYFYTVDPAFATPTRSAYRADGGYLGTDLSISWLKSLDDAFELLLGGRVSSFHGAVNRNSPLFTADMTYSVYAVISWKFWESERRELKLE